MENFYTRAASFIWALFLVFLARSIKLHYIEAKVDLLHVCMIK